MGIEVYAIKSPIFERDSSKVRHTFGDYCFAVEASLSRGGSSRALSPKATRGEAGKIALNLLKCDFTATVPNRLWVTDFTEFTLFGGKLYLSPIMDLYNREIVCYTISERPNFPMTMQMLNGAFKRLSDDADLILHSDLGWQYQMRRYQHRLCERGIRQSGNSLDNAAMEFFFGFLKSELLYLQKFRSIEHFRCEFEN